MRERGGRCEEAYPPSIRGNLGLENVLSRSAAARAWPRELLFAEGCTSVRGARGAAILGAAFVVGAEGSRSAGIHRAVFAITVYAASTWSGSPTSFNQLMAALFIAARSAGSTQRADRARRRCLRGDDGRERAAVYRR
jgi:hypothetical protein